jgi:hypothetical protein
MLRQRLARAIQSTMPWWWRDRQSSVSDLVERGSYSTPLGLGEHFVEQLARCKCIRVRVAVGGARTATGMSGTEVVDGDGGGHHAFCGYHNFRAYAQGHRGLVLHRFSEKRTQIQSTILFSLLQ